MSVGSAILPTLSAQWARGDRDAMSATLSHAMRLIAFVALPSAIGMFILSQPITEVLFLGREFKFQDALATAEVIQVYAFGLLISAGVRIMVQGFYSVGNTWYPALVGAISLVSHIVFAWAGTRAFGLKGLAGATVASSLVNLIMLSVAYSRWLGTLHWAQLGARIVRFALCGILLGLGCLVYEPYAAAPRTTLTDGPDGRSWHDGGRGSGRLIVINVDGNDEPLDRSARQSAPVAGSHRRAGSGLQPAPRGGAQ